MRQRNGIALAAALTGAAIFAGTAHGGLPSRDGGVAHAPSRHVGAMAGGWTLAAAPRTGLATFSLFGACVVVSTRRRSD